MNKKKQKIIIFEPAWLEGFVILKEETKKDKLNITFDKGEVLTYCKIKIKQQKLKIKIPDLNKAYVKYNAIVFLIDSKINYVISGIPKNYDKRIVLLYSIDITVSNCKISGIDTLDLRSKVLS